MVMILTLVISCTTDKKQNHIIEVVKGIKEIKNSNTPENENFKIEIKKEGTINGEPEKSYAL
jgi:hypothetical protein